MISQIQKIGMLAVLILSTFLPAYSIIRIDGIYYDFLADRELSVANYGNGVQYEGDIIIPERLRYNGKIYHVVAISEKAFYKCTALTGVTIPNSVTTIGRDAFYGCSSLSAVTISNSVTTISRDAFHGCSSLSAVTIPNSVTSIEEGAFYNCSSLSAVIIPNSVTTISMDAFNGCSSLSAVTIPNSVTTISRWTFSRCSSLRAVTIPNSVTTISDEAFSGCSSLAEVSLPSSVSSMGDEVFSHCSLLSAINVDADNPYFVSLDGVVFSKNMDTLVLYPEGKQNMRYDIPNSVTTIRRQAFSGCSSLTALTIPNSVTTISDGAFSGCSSLSAVTIPNSVTTISDKTFSECSSLSAVTIPNSVTTISYGAFYGCSSLSALTIPNSVTTIGKAAFSGIPLRVINCEITDPIKCNPGFSTTVLDEATLYVPMGTLKKYQKCDPWCDFWNIVEKDFNAVESVPSEEVSVTVQDGCICIDGVRSNVEIYVYDLQGNNVYSGFATRIADLAKGIYIVTVGKTSVKVQLR